MTDIAGRWLRVSTGGQDEASQEPDVSRHVSQHGYAEGPTYRLHGESASKGEQDPYIAQVIADGKAGKLQVLVAWHVDRLDRRGPWATGLMISALNRAGVRVETTDGGEVSDRDLNGLVKQWSAREESEHKAKRIRAKQSALRASGSWASGKAPYGYQIVRRDGVKTLAPLDSEAPHASRMFELAAQGKTCLEISNALKAEGVPTRTGRNDRWAEGTINQILRSVIYRGVVEYDGKPYMTVPALTTSALWLKANESLKARSRSVGRGSKGRTSTVLLRPVCECGAPMYRYGTRMRCAGLGPAGNSTGRKGCGNTMDMETLNAEVIGYFEGSGEEEIIETSIAAEDYTEAIATVRLALRDLDDLSDTYDVEHAALRLELRELLNAQEEAAPSRTEVISTGRTEGQAFGALKPEDQKAWLRSRYVIRVYREETVSEGRVTRWVAGWKGGNTTR